MEEINLKDLFNYILNKKWYVILITICVAVAGFIYVSYYKTPMYKSYTTILLTKEGNSETITYSDVNLNKNLVDTYSEIIKSKKVIDKVINNLSLNYTVGELQSRVSVSSINNTEIIKISVIDEDAKYAKMIANEIATVFNVEVVKLYNIQNIGIIDVAEESKTPYNISVLKTTVLALLIGLVLGLGVVFVIFYFDTTIKNVEEVERKTGLSVIGTIPLAGGKKNE